MKGAVAVAGLGLMLTASLAYAGGFFTNGVPPAGGTQYPSTIPLTGNETLPADTNLSSGLNPQSEAISTRQMANFAAANGITTQGNFLIGGDATTNLFQRATTGSSVTTTATYGGPDRWFYWSGASTAMTVSRDSTAADLPTGYQYDFKMQRTASQTGVVQMCMAQVVSSQNSYALAGQTVELDFHAATGANFSPAAPYNMTAYIVSGTGADEGSADLAKGLNGGGGGSVGWTGQANATAAVIALGGVSKLGRYAAVASIPAAATEVGVALCYTPVGTAGTTDALFFSGIQLVKNPSNVGAVNVATGYSCDNSFNTQIQCVPFQRRAASLEASLQYAYYYQLSEVTGPSVVANCRAHSVTVAECFVPTPVPMRAAATVTYASPGFATETTTAGGTLGACNTLATAATSSPVGSTQGILVGCTATTVPAAGSADLLWNNGGSGAIKFSAEL